MKDNLVQKKSYSFAIQIVDLYKYLSKNKSEYVLSKQVLKSGTSIGANIEEAIGASSKRDFLAKMTIAYKETRETIYWLKLLRHSGYLTKEESTILLNQCDELIRIIGSIQKSIKSQI